MRETIERDWTSKIGYRCIILAKSTGFRNCYIAVPPCSSFYKQDFKEKSPAIKDSFLASETFQFYFDLYGTFISSGFNEDFGSVEELWWFGFECDDWGDVPDMELIGHPKRYDDTYDPQDRTIIDTSFCVKECEKFCGALFHHDVGFQRYKKLEKLLK